MIKSIVSQRRCIRFTDASSLNEVRHIFPVCCSELKAKIVCFSKGKGFAKYILQYQIKRNFFEIAVWLSVMLLTGSFQFIKYLSWGTT